MTDTRFPEPKFTKVARPDLYVVTREELTDWFTRCIESFPVQGAYFSEEKPFIEWFEAWFSQFKETEK